MKIKRQKGYISVYGESIPLKVSRFITGYKDAKVTASYPFIFFLDESFERDYIVNHEMIHFKQKIELLFILPIIIQQIEFYYAKYYLKKDNYNSYLYNCLEQEAYLNHNNPNYLKDRKMFSVLKYLFNKKDITYNKDTGEVKII